MQASKKVGLLVRVMFFHPQGQVHFKAPDTIATALLCRKGASFAYRGVNKVYRGERKLILMEGNNHLRCAILIQKYNSKLNARSV